MAATDAPHTSPDMTFRAPPIWEIAMSVMTAGPELFSPYDVRAVHNLFREEYPRAERQDAFGGIAPPMTRGAPMNLPGQMDLQLLSQSAVPTRWWFLDEMGNGLVQIQENFTALNWRRLVPPPARVADYPGFDRFHSQFQENIRRLSKWHAENKTSMPPPTNCELLYDNLIDLSQPDGERIKLGDALTVLKLTPGIAVAGVNAAWHERIDPLDHEAPMGLNISIAHVGVPDPSGGQLRSFMKLQLAARSLVTSWSEVFEFFEVAHRRVRQRLLDLTSEEIRATWAPK